jgi:hypothetical protein
MICIEDLFSRIDILIITLWTEEIFTWDDFSGFWIHAGESLRGSASQEILSFVLNPRLIPVFIIVWSGMYTENSDDNVPVN